MISGSPIPSPSGWARKIAGALPLYVAEASPAYVAKASPAYLAGRHVRMVFPALHSGRARKTAGALPLYVAEASSAYVECFAVRCASASRGSSTSTAVFVLGGD